MKVLLYGINFSPELTGVGKYTGEMAERLTACGHDVRVVTAPPYYPEWRIGTGYRADRYVCEDWHGAWIVRCPLWVPNKPGGVRRILHLMSFALSSFPAVLWQVFWHPDIVWTVEPSLLCAPVAWATARLSGARTWLHIQDFEVDAAFELGLINGGFSRRVIARWERSLMRRFDKVSTISGRMMERVIKKGVPEDRAVLFPNWTSFSFDGDSSVESDGIREELGISREAVVALYSGSMGRKQGLEVLAEAATAVSDLQDLVFVFCGNGPGRDGLVAACSGLSNVRFLDLQPVERVPSLLGMADIHLLPQRADAADLVLPSKLAGMLASERPVIATCAQGTEIAKVVEGHGIITPPEDAAALADAIRRLYADKGLRVRLGANARTYAEQHLARDAILGDFEAALEALVQENDG